MWKQKIGISVGNQYAVPTSEVVKIVKASGFDAISPVWETLEKLTEIAETARECGLELQSLHAPFFKAADMWSSDPVVYTECKADILASLEACVRFRIPVLVVHTWIGFEPYTCQKQDLYFKNFEELVAKAKENGVKIAFENTEGEEFLFALMEHFAQEDTVGFCWDSGHEQCYNHAQDLLAKLGDRLYMTHLNDNLGISRLDGSIFWTDDLHLLPFDGVIDWHEAAKRLKNSRPLPFLNFELNIQSKPDRHENDGYAAMPLTLYFAEAYKRACRVAYLYAK